MIKNMNVRIIEKLKKNWALSVVVTFSVVVAIYAIIKGDRIHLTLLDMMDSFFSDYKMVIDNDALWKNDVLLPFLGGLDSNCLISGMKVYTWLFYLFSPLDAFLVGWFLKIYVSVISFLCLSRVLSLRNDMNLTIICGFLYGLTPAAPPLSFCTATLPLLLSLLILLYRDKVRLWVLLCLLLYPLFSYFVFFGIFICGYILLFIIMDWFVSKKIKVRMLTGLFALFGGYVITEYNLFFSAFSNYKSTIRQEISRESVDLWNIIIEIGRAFANGHYHCGSLHTIVILPTCMAYFVYVNYKHIRRKDGNVLYDKYNWLIVIILINSIFSGLEKSIYFKSFIDLLIPPLSGFNFSRAVWLSPFLWYFSFFIVLYRTRILWVRYVLIVASFGAVCLGHTNYNFIRLNIGYEVLSLIREDTDYERGYWSFREFYSESLFEKMKNEIRYNGEWSVAYALYPSVLEYNGISTLDGYSPYYSLNYKNEFIELIKPELEKNEEYADYFAHDGRRAYIFSEEYPASRKIYDNSQGADIFINIGKFKEMQGKYIFSRVRLLNSEELGLEELGPYTDVDSPYTIYIYTTK